MHPSLPHQVGEQRINKVIELINVALHALGLLGCMSHSWTQSLRNLLSLPVCHLH